MKIKNIVLMLMISVLTGCASGYKITYNTEPSGASVICGGINRGYSPVTLNYTPDENNKRTGSMKTVPCTAVWSSGARKYFSTAWDLNEFPEGVMQTLKRPNGEGYTQDAEFALKVEQMKKSASSTSSSGGFSTTVNCKKLMSFSTEVRSFQGSCPYGFIRVH